MKDLVQIVNNEPRVSHSVIANNTDKAHRSIRILIDDNLSDFEEFGEVKVFEEKVKTAGGMQKQKTFYLNEQQYSLLMTYLRNNPVVKEFKKNMIKAFFMMRKEIANSNAVDTNKTRELNARIGGLTYANNMYKNKIELLESKLANQKLLPHKSLEENIDTLVYQTQKELKADTRRLDFFQNRANYFAKYVKILRTTGTEQQKYTITEIDRYKNESIKAQKEVVEVQQKLENLQKVVDDYTNISNMMLKTRYVS